MLCFRFLSARIGFGSIVEQIERYATALFDWVKSEDAIACGRTGDSYGKLR